MTLDHRCSHPRRVAAKAGRQAKSPPPGRCVSGPEAPDLLMRAHERPAGAAPTTCRRHLYTITMPGQGHSGLSLAEAGR
eukprot:9011384-Pyramimonas_sp.AAC.1